MSPREVTGIGCPPLTPTASPPSHSYRCRGTSSNIGVTPSGKIVYPAAATLVVYDPAAHTQALYVSVCVGGGGGGGGRGGGGILWKLLLMHPHA